MPEISLFQSLPITLDSKSKSVKVDNHYQTSIPHIYACGNALHVHDLVDIVAMEAELAGHFALHDLNEKK